MPVFNYAKKEVNLKIVYYGPGLSGKTTNLQAVHDGIKPDFKGKLVSLATQTDRTLFFDFMPLELGSLGGFRVRLHLYTVPGQVHYNATRKLVLKGVDGIVFVADSQRAMTDANIESFVNLEKNLQSYGKALEEIPHVIQVNKMDLEDVLPRDEIDLLLNRHGAPVTEAVASEGRGVLETLTEISRMVMKGLKDQLNESRRERAHSEGASSRPVHESSIRTEQTGTPAPEEKASQATVPEPEPPVPEPVSEQAHPIDSPPNEEVKFANQDHIQPDLPEPAPGTSESEWPEMHEMAGENFSRPFRTVIHLEGLGTIELSLAISARIIDEGRQRSVAVSVEGATLIPGQEGGEQGGPAITQESAQLKAPEQDPASIQTAPIEPSEEPLQPLAGSFNEPLGAPLDGQDDEVLEISEVPIGTDTKGPYEVESASPVTESDASESVQQYDPAPQPVDLLDEEKPELEKEGPKKKSVMGLFKKKERI